LDKLKEAIRNPDWIRLILTLIVGACIAFAGVQILQKSVFDLGKSLTRIENEVKETNIQLKEMDDRLLTVELTKADRGSAVNPEDFHRLEEKVESLGMELVDFKGSVVQDINYAVETSETNMIRNHVSPLSNRVSRLEN
jgi:hypothetical protein